MARRTGRKFAERGRMVCLTLVLGIGVFGGTLVGIVRFLRWRDTGLLLFSLFPGLGATLLAALFTRCCQRMIERAEKAARMPYIPSVAPSEFPAEEVFVRGSIEPDAAHETLLRAAQGDEETKPEELLRSHLP